LNKNLEKNNNNENQNTSEDAKTNKISTDINKNNKDLNELNEKKEFTEFMKSCPVYYEKIFNFKTKEEIENFYRNYPGKLSTIIEIYNDYSILNENEIKNYSSKILVYNFYSKNKIIKRIKSI
jgi:hypothetical protein